MSDDKEEIPVTLEMMTAGDRTVLMSDGETDAQLAVNVFRAMIRAAPTDLAFNGQGIATCTKPILWR